MSDEWNPTDPDSSKVYYDLSAWSFDQQAELSSELADRELPHFWDGSELVLPEEREREADEMFIVLEQRLGIISEPQGDGSDLVAIELAAETPSTEYDLGEWDELERELVADSLTGAEIAFRWENMVLLVATADEERVDSILDDVESGHILVVSDDDDGGGEHSDPFETLNSFFLASTRLSKDVRDSTGLQRLLEALEVANPNRPPVGIELVTWRKSCELAEGIADGLVEEDGNPDDSAELALQLHDLLRPLI